MSNECETPLRHSAGFPSSAKAMEDKSPASPYQVLIYLNYDLLGIVGQEARQGATLL